MQTTGGIGLLTWVLLLFLPGWLPTSVGIAWGHAIGITGSEIFHVAVMLAVRFLMWQ